MIGFIVAGLVIGALARLVKPGKQNLSVVATLLLGLVGSVIGGLVANLLGTGGIFELNIMVSSSRSSPRSASSGSPKASPGHDASPSPPGEVNPASPDGNCRLGGPLDAAPVHRHQRELGGHERPARNHQPDRNQHQQPLVTACPPGGLVRGNSEVYGRRDDHWSPAHLRCPGLRPVPAGSRGQGHGQ